MTFARRYFIWLAFPPAAVSIPLTIVFLNQIERLDSGQLLRLALAIAGVYALEFLAIRQLLIGPIRAVEVATAKSQEVGRVISNALVATENASALTFSIGAVLMGVAGGLSSDTGWLSARHFFVAGLILGGPPLVWCYAAGKRLLVAVAGHDASLAYEGRSFKFATKVALIFVGFLIISFSALVQLVSARVTIELENLAIVSATERFDRVFQNAKDAARIDTTTVDTLREYLPSGYQLVAISPTGILGSSRDLTPREVSLIRAKRDGDSSSFNSTHVVIFRPLPGGDILAMTIPWAAYEQIPTQITFYTIVIAILTILTFILAAYFLSHEVGDSLRRLMSMSAEMSYGNFQTHSHIFADDEVGDLAASFMETGRNLARLLAKVGGSGAAITDGVRVIGGGTETMTRRSHEQTALATSSTVALGNVRAGIESLVQAADGVANVTQDSSSRALELQASSEEIAHSMDVLFQSVEKTSSSTTEMHAAAGEMSKRTQVLASIGDEVLTFVSEMEATARELRQSAHATADLSKKVEEDAAVGGAAVGNTLDGITRSQEMTARTVAVLSELRRSVGTISQILTVIEEIADRTNLLSLNAAIIAAQAGEQGAGFTVVADEIRKLAERTRGSTKEITAIIKAVQRGSREAMMTMEEGVGLVDENVALAQNAASSLSMIVMRAGESFDMATKISSALQDQAVASKHLHEVSSRMSDHISEINRSTSEQARGTRMLAVEAERVRDIAFQVKGSTEQQTIAGRGIAGAMEEISDEVTSMRNLLQAQLEETRQIASAAETMRAIAEENESIASDFKRAIGSLSQNANEFDSEVRRFKIGD